VNRTFAYSFDRETFVGSFESRAQAFEAAVRRAQEMNNQVDQVYVGLRVPGDAQAAGHARELIKTMRKRAAAAFGDAASDYLFSVTPEQQRDLDGAIETTVLRWLQNYRLTPTFNRIEAISEHPIPTVSAAASSSSRESEVYDLGESDYSPR
jgi:hypothetical protein